MNYAFTFDASACTGCKACQEACKDKNGLPIGMLWRRVIEISGGNWWTTDHAWESNVFAYNLTLACNHCTHPKCAGVCPTDAYTVRQDGIVLIDATRCMGCGYCTWACPYGAPQYDPTQGIVTKCDFCYDNLDAGVPPTCVSACPLRVLNYGTIEDPISHMKGQNLWLLPASEHPFPLPDYSRTEPHLVIKPHTGMSNPLEKLVSNIEEILPPQSYENRKGNAGLHEIPLVLFTLLTQMAVGMSVFGLVVSPLPQAVMMAIGILLVVGGVTSFLHLGRKRNAWRAMTHLKKSWLSREVLATGLFGIAWATTAGAEWLNKASFNHWPMVILGFSLIYCMSRVYYLRAVPSWNSWRTTASFYLSAAVLGMLGVRLVVADFRLTIIVCLALLVEMGMLLTVQPTKGDSVVKLRLALLGLGFMGALFITIIPPGIGAGMPILVFIIALAAEAIGRWQFYAARVPFPLQLN